MDIENIAEFIPFNMPMSVLMLGLGLLVLLFGYRIKKITFFIIWFLLGFNLMSFLMPAINDIVPQVAGDQMYQTLLPIAGGLLLALMGFSIEKLCVGGICFVLVMTVTIRYFGADLSTVVMAGIIGVIAAGAAVTLMKPAIIIATAVAGAYTLAVGLSSVSEDINFATFYWPMLIVTSIVGATFQFLTTKHID